MCSLSILCVTRLEPHAGRFLLEMHELAGRCGGELVVCVDGDGDSAIGKVHHVHSAGYIESVLDECIGYCSGDYVLRLDDDERASPALAAWLESGRYNNDYVWSLPRANLWGDERHYIANEPLWPDHQTRLAPREKSGRPPQIHTATIHGPVAEAPYILEHHKFLVKTYQERREIAERYERIQAGAGLGEHFGAFSLPEDYLEDIQTAELGEGWLWSGW